jgi:hypothetical protein
MNNLIIVKCWYVLIYYITKSEFFSLFRNNKKKSEIWGVKKYFF